MKRKKKIIIITSRFPFPLDKGDKLRIYHQIRYISTHNDIYLIALNTEKYISKECFDELKKYCKQINIIKINLLTRCYNLIKAFISNKPLQVGYFYSKKAQGEIDSIISNIQPDWCYSQLIRTAEYTKNKNNNVIDYMDALSKGIERRVKKFPLFLQPLIKREFYITKKYEIDILNKFKKQIIITANDRDYINHEKRELINIISNGVDTNYFRPRPTKLKTYDIVFVGNMNYPPNIVAAVYLCEKILPIIEKQYKICKVLIGGTNPHNKVKRLANKNITISGWVKDIRETYRAGKIFVAPMFIGTGLQNKLLEAMAMGIPSITTTLANNALLANKSQIIIANNHIEFANACVKILKNKNIADNLSNEGLKFVRKKYDWNKINNDLNLIFK